MYVWFYCAVILTCLFTFWATHINYDDMRGLNMFPIAFCSWCYRLWYVYERYASKSSLENAIPTEVGYMNVIPKCLDASTKYPIYEHLPDTYAAVNAYLSETPLEGWYI